ncbi:MAG: hypothetical protein GF307_09415 [candidate division Zixibacteria bacterium]|nr:hypothetical protein [candidate division Zixibacteria bacterium]
MNKKDFSIDNALRFGWETFRNNIGLFIIIGIFNLVISYTPDLIDWVLESYGAQAPVLSTVIGIFYVIIELGIALGYTKIALIFCDGEQAKIADLFSCFHLLPRYLITLIIILIPVLVGLALFIIPGLYLIVRFLWFVYFIIDFDEGIIVSIKKSWRFSEGIVLKLFLFGIILFAINLLGFLLFLVGSIVTTAITTVAGAYVYRELLPQMDDNRESLTFNTTA